MLVCREVVNEAAKSATGSDASRSVSAQVLTMQPELFSACSPHVPLARAARSMQKAARLDIDSIFGSINSLEVSKSTRVRPLSGGSGPCVEVVMTTPLNCGLRNGIRLIRDWITAKRYRNINEVSYSSLVRVTEFLGDVNKAGA